MENSIFLDKNIVFQALRLEPGDRIKVGTTIKDTRITANTPGRVKQVKVGMGKGKVKTLGLSVRTVTIHILLANSTKHKRRKSLI